VEKELKTVPNGSPRPLSSRFIRRLAGLGESVGFATWARTHPGADSPPLRVHHVRDDLGAPLWWDVGFLVFGVLLTGGGWLPTGVVRG
jgi:hypothetical protein